MKKLISALIVLCFCANINAGDPPDPDPCSSCKVETKINKLCTNCQAKEGTRYACEADEDVKCEGYTPGTQCKAEEVETNCTGPEGCCGTMDYPLPFLTCDRTEPGKSCECKPAYGAATYSGGYCK